MPSSRERVRSTFLEDLRAFIEENVPEKRRAPAGIDIVQSWHIIQLHGRDNGC